MVTLRIEMEELKKEVMNLLLGDEDEVAFETVSIPNEQSLPLNIMIPPQSTVTRGYQPRPEALQQQSVIADQGKVVSRDIKVMNGKKQEVITEYIGAQQDARKWVDGDFDNLEDL